MRTFVRLGVSLAIDSTTFEKMDPQESGMDMLLMTTSKQLKSSDIAGSSDDNIVLRHFIFTFSIECGRYGRLSTWGWKRSERVADLGSLNHFFRDLVTFDCSFLICEEDMLLMARWKNREGVGKFRYIHTLKSPYWTDVNPGQSLIKG